MVLFPKGEYSGKAETITIGVPPLEQNALLYVADHEDFSSIMASIL